MLAFSEGPRMLTAAKFARTSSHGHPLGTGRSKNHRGGEGRVWHRDVEDLHPVRRPNADPIPRPRTTETNLHQVRPGQAKAVGVCKFGSPRACVVHWKVMSR